MLKINLQVFQNFVFSLGKHDGAMNDDEEVSFGIGKDLILFCQNRGNVYRK